MESQTDFDAKPGVFKGTVRKYGCITNLIRNRSIKERENNKETTVDEVSKTRYSEVARKHEENR